MMRGVFFNVIIVLFFCVCKGEFPSNDLRFHEELESGGKLELFWDWWGEEENRVEIEVHGLLSPKAWMAIGFSGDGQVENADFCMFYVDSAGRSHVKDVWSDNGSVVHLDRKQDCKVVQAYRRSGKLVLRFQRALDNCDEHDYVIEGGTTHVVYALGFGPLKSVEGVRLNRGRKVFRNFKRMHMLAPHLEASNVPEDTRIIDITVNNVLIPNEETTYWCVVAEMPDLRRKNHIIAYEAFITEGNEDLVHHMEVFHCQLDEHETMKPFEGPCSTAMGGSVGGGSCSKVIGAWAMGAPKLEYPNEAGYPIGGDISGYVMVEVHYNNPQLHANKYDSSGIRFHVTSHLRNFDVAVMELGLEYSPKMAIPPKQQNFELVGHCIAECTQAGLGHRHDGIHVFASQLHTHLTGTKVFTKHYRNGVELPELNRDNHYNTMFQQIRRLPQPVLVMPGDELTTTCVYDTSNRLNATLGGFAIADEMCVNYIHYYPKTRLELCKSSISDKYLDKFFDHVKKQFNNTLINENQSVEKNYYSIKYNPAIVQIQDQFYKSSPLSMQCNQSNGQRFPGMWDGKHQTLITEPLPSTPKSHCTPKSFNPNTNTPKLATQIKHYQPKNAKPTKNIQIPKTSHITTKNPSMKNILYFLRQKIQLKQKNAIQNYKHTTKVEKHSSLVQPKVPSTQSKTSLLYATPQQQKDDILSDEKQDLALQNYPTSQDREEEKDLFFAQHANDL